MSAMKIGTKLTDNPKDYMLRVRMDRDTLEQLDKICRDNAQSRSEAVRDCIKKQYQQTKK